MIAKERITEKKEELMEIYRDLPEDVLEVASDLIGQAAFMAVLLEELQEDIEKNGVVEEYTNGANQTGRKQSTAAKTYNSIIGKYSSVIAKLLSLLPKEPDQRTIDRAELEKQKQKEQEEKAQHYEEQIREQKKKDDLFLKALARGEVEQSQYREYINDLS